tara:strand:- start:3717 stop:4112 length:396 start_codon:yes stop_codon:yes gene_type:complete
MVEIFHYNHCRLCKSEEIYDVLDLGMSAVANSFLSNEELEKKEFFAPLKVFQCKTCGNVQLRDTVNPEILFSHYLYTFGNSANFVKNFKTYAESVVEYLSLSENSSILEIGSNDGILLKPYRDFGMSVTGV